MAYHTDLVEYTHRCDCGECVNVVTYSPALAHDLPYERVLAHDVFRIHRMLLGQPLPPSKQAPPGFEGPSTG